MTLFQYVSLTLLGLIVLAELGRWLSRGGRGRASLLRCVVWVSAALAIAFPVLVQDVAGMLGIGRGADVVLYLFVLVFLLTAFNLYSRLLRQQQQITKLVRHLAIAEARRGPVQPEGEGSDPGPARS
jgi:hypothetical protein